MKRTQPLRVLQVAAEILPLIKTSGLADVVGALPPALAGVGVDTRYDGKSSLTEPQGEAAAARAVSPKGAEQDRRGTS